MSQLLPHCGRKASQEGGVEEAWGGGGKGTSTYRGEGLPGAMVHTRMLYLAKSLAIGRVIPTMAPLLAEYAAWPTCPSKAATLAVLMITPVGKVRVGVGRVRDKSCSEVQRFSA